MLVWLKKQVKFTFNKIFNVKNKRSHRERNLCSSLSSETLRTYRMGVFWLFIRLIALKKVKSIDFLNKATLKHIGGECFDKRKAKE